MMLYAVCCCVLQPRDRTFFRKPFTTNVQAKALNAINTNFRSFLNKESENFLIDGKEKKRSSALTFF